MSKKNGRYIDEEGNEFHYLNDRLHRLDGPAVVYKNSEFVQPKRWFIDGVRYDYSSWISIMKSDYPDDYTKYMMLNI